MINLITTCFSGILFGFGLALSGMLDPSKVQAFLDITRNWDPSLMFVMVGGIIITFIGYYFILKRPTPLFSDVFHIPVHKHIDKNLIGGSALFGIGWGLGGLCPGPALGILSYNFIPGLIFMSAMLIGLFIGRKFKK
tara:strand:+ start:108 stop:518 length:411 start_codon:yes stop_codon:yes gene_type:complete